MKEDRSDRLRAADYPAAKKWRKQARQTYARRVHQEKRSSTGGEGLRYWRFANARCTVALSEISRTRLTIGI
jgi:hypothetical protein